MTKRYATISIGYRSVPTVPQLNHKY